MDDNTLLLNGNTFYSIELRFGTTKDAMNGNLVNATPSYFQNPAAGDLHLLPGATPAINKVPCINTVTNDFDGEMRPNTEADIERMSSSH